MIWLYARTPRGRTLRPLLPRGQHRKRLADPVRARYFAKNLCSAHIIVAHMDLLRL